MFLLSAFTIFAMGKCPDYDDDSDSGSGDGGAARHICMARACTCGCLDGVCAASVVPTVVLVAVAAVGVAGHVTPAVMRIFFAVLLCVSLPKLLFTVVSLAGRAAALVVPAAAHFVNIGAAALAVVTAAAFLYGFVFGWRRIVVREVEISSPRLPEAFDGYRMAHISDLHLGTYGNDTAFVHRFVERVNSLHPDVILFTGDLVNSSAAEVEPHAAVLSRLRAPEGVVSVLGNHDYCEYNRYGTRDGARRQLERLISLERGMGWRLLLDESVEVRRGAAAIAVIGVENTGRPPFPAPGQPAAGDGGGGRHHIQDTPYARPVALAA